VEQEIRESIDALHSRITSVRELIQGRDGLQSEVVELLTRLKAVEAEVSELRRWRIASLCAIITALSTLVLSWLK